MVLYLGVIRVRVSHMLKSNNSIKYKAVDSVAPVWLFTFFNKAQESSHWLCMSIWSPESIRPPASDNSVFQTIKSPNKCSRSTSPDYQDIQDIASHACIYSRQKTRSTKSRPSRDLLSPAEILTSGRYVLSPMGQISSYRAIERYHLHSTRAYL